MTAKMFLTSIPHDVEVVRELTDRVGRHPRFVWEEVPITTTPLGQEGLLNYTKALVLAESYRESTPIQIEDVFGTHSRFQQWQVEVRLHLELIENREGDHVDIYYSINYAEKSCFYEQKTFEELPERTQAWAKERCTYLVSDLQRLVDKYAVSKHTA